MSELIKIDYSNDRPAVSARDLHEFLEVGSEYSHWFKRMCEYGFIEGQDFSPFLTESTGEPVAFHAPYSPSGVVSGASGAGGVSVPSCGVGGVCGAVSAR